MSEATARRADVDRRVVADHFGIALLASLHDVVTALFGCCSSANRVLDQHPEVPPGIEVPSVLEARDAELDDARVDYALGRGVDDPDRYGFAAAADAARGADVAIIVVGDRAGLFGRGSSGEGCDADSLELPGVQRDPVEHVLATGTPVVLVAVTSRPDALDRALTSCAAVVQTFFPGEEGAAAVAGVLSGRVNPSGRQLVSMPRSAGSQPSSYLHPPLGGPSSVSNLDNEPARAFGSGLSCTTFTHDDLRVQADAVPTDRTIDVTVRVTNTGPRAGVDVVQLYAHEPVAALSWPVAQPLGYARVELEAGNEATSGRAVPTTRLAFTGRYLVRAVEPGLVEPWVGASCTERETQAGRAGRCSPSSHRRGPPAGWMSTGGRLLLHRERAEAHGRPVATVDLATYVVRPQPRAGHRRGRTCRPPRFATLCNPTTRTRQCCREDSWRSS